MASKKVKIAYFPGFALKAMVVGSNGTALDNCCIKAYTTENIDGTYVLDATFTVDDAGFLEELDILKCQMDYGKDYFRISKIDKDTRYIVIAARQITIQECLSLYLDDVRPTNTNGQGALTYLKSHAEGVKDIELYSDISSSNTAYYQDMDLYKAIHDCDQSFLTRWGGEILRRGYKLSILTKVGENRGVSIRERKNLKGFKCSTNIDSIVTKARGKGYNDIVGSWQDSPILNNYPRVFRNTYDYKVRIKDDQEEDPEYSYFDTEDEAKSELDRLASLEFTKNNVDKIKGTYEIDFVQLEKTKLYSEYTQAERVLIGDTVRVYIKRLNTDISVRCIEKTYDVMAQKTGTIKLSNENIVATKSMADIVKSLKDQLINNNNNNVGEYIKSILSSGMQNSHVVVRTNEILIMDTKDINTAQNVWRWNGGALAHSSSGYYTSDWNIGITQEGVINADMIMTGVLTAILIKSKDGSCTINLDTGEINFAKGIIKGLNSSWNLDTGVFTSTGVDAAQQLRDVKIINGEIKANNYLGIRSKIGTTVRCQPEEAHIDPNNGELYAYVWGAGMHGKKINISSGSDGIHLTADAGGSADIVLTGNVKIYGSLKLNEETVYAGTGGGTTGGGSALQQSVVSHARELIGVPYLYGGNYTPCGSNSGTDCSGLCQNAYRRAGISISRTTYTQINEGVEVSGPDSLQPGDLVFPRATTDNGHVFLFSGKNSDGALMCIEAYDDGYNISEHSFTWGSTYRARRLISD